MFCHALLRPACYVFAMLCLPMLRNAMPAMFWIALIWYDLICLAMLCYAWLCFVMLCFFYDFALLCCARICLALLCLAMLGFALLCLAMLGSAMLCWCCSRHFKNSGTQELGLPKHYKNSGTQVSGAIFLEPESCLPLLSRAGILYTCSLLEKHPDFDPNHKFLEKMLVWVPMVWGGTAGPKKWKIT